MSLRAKIPGKLTEYDSVGHIPREISRFCRYVVNYSGLLEARVRDPKYRPSPISSRGLQILISLHVSRGTPTVFDKMENCLQKYYVEPDIIMNNASIEEGSFWNTRRNTGRSLWNTRRFFWRRCLHWTNWTEWNYCNRRWCRSEFT